MESKAKNDPLTLAREIAALLKQSDPKYFRDIFAMVNRAAKGWMAPPILLGVMRALKREFDAGRRPRDLWEYFVGTARRLKESDEGARMRAGNTEGMQVMDVLAEVLRRSGYKVEKK